MKRLSALVSFSVAFGTISTLALAQGGAVAPPPVQKPAPPAAPVAAPQIAPETAKPFPAGSKIAFINVARIAAESTEGKALNTQAVNVRGKKVAELALKNKELGSLRQKLQSGGLLSATARATTQKEADKLQVEIERAQQDADAELTELQRQLQQDFQRKLTPVIEKLVADMQLHVLFSQTEAGVVWLDPSLDLTAETIKRFDAAMAASKAPAKTPAPRE